MLDTFTPTTNGPTHGLTDVLVMAFVDGQVIHSNAIADLRWFEINLLFVIKLFWICFEILVK